MIERTPAQATERMRNLLAFLLVGAFISVIPMAMMFVIPEKNRDLVTYAVGQLSGMALLALGFFFVNKAGQDAADEKRADNTGKALDAMKAVAENTGGATPADASKAADQVADAAADEADTIRGK